LSHCYINFFIFNILQIGIAQPPLSYPQGVKLHLPSLEGPCVRLNGWDLSPSMQSKTNLALLVSLSLLLTAFGAGCSRDPNVRKQKFFIQGNTDFDRGKYPEAMISYGRALQIDPRFAEGHYKLAQCHLKQGTWMAAYQELTRTIDLQAENWPAQLDLAKLLLAAGKAQEAKDKSLLILRSNPKHANAQMLLSNADALLGNLKDALQEAKDATAMAPDHSAVYLNLGMVEAKADAFNDAETNLRKAQTLDPVSLPTLMTLGNFYLQQKRWADAEKIYQSAISLAPKNALPHAALSSLYLNQGQEVLAEKTLADAKQQLSDNPAGYRMLGDYYLSRGEHAKALTEFGALSAEHQADLPVRKIYIQLLILNHRIDEAARLNDEILKKSPQDAESLILKGQVQFQQKKVDESIQTLQQAVKNAPDNAAGHYQLGVAFQLKGNTSQAENEWHKAVQLRPALAEAWLALGSATMQRADWRALEPIGDHLKKIAPRSAEGYLFHATARINQADPVAAEADLNQLIQIAPQNALGYIKLGQLRVAQKRWDEAEKMYRQGLTRDPNSLDAVQGLVDLDFRRNKSADALRLIQAQLDHNPNNSALHLLQGEALLKNKQPEGAERSFERAVEIDKQNVKALVLLAQIHSSHGKLDQAIASYKRALEAAPSNVRLYVALASSYEAQGNWQQAQTLYEKALAIQPDDALAANNLAYILLEHGGSVNVALTYAQTARRGLPDLPNSADTLGWAYYHNGAFSVAAPLFEDAVKKVPGNLTYRYHLGLAYQKLNDFVQARTQFEKIINVDPKSPVAEQARHALSGISGR
jgi:tetratricopeptide (TPR) repeat protein